MPALPMQRRDRPNILLVIADDQSWRDCGAYGSRAVSTPAFDRIGREGVRFTNSFCASPSCTPSRSGVLMGRHVWQQGEAGVLYGGMPPSIPLYPHLLEDAGYFTGYTGKGWGPGDWKALGLDRDPCGSAYQGEKHRDPVPEGISNVDYAANFARFLAGRPQGKPFCFWLGSYEPHRLYDTGRGVRTGKKLEDANVPRFLPDAPEVRSDILDYYSEIDWFDRQLVRALEVLQSTGELDRTLIVVTSDNGMPFPRAKANLYDWGTRMPLAIRWGDAIPRGRVIDDLVSHVDFAPTFLDAAGIPIPDGVMGKSLLPLLTSNRSGTVNPARDGVFTAMERHTMCRPNGATYPMRALRTHDHLYIHNYAPDRWPTGGPFLSSNKTFHGDIDGGPSKDFLLLDSTRQRFPREVEWCLAKRPAEELYDVSADPAQTSNLARDPKHAPALSDLRRRLQDYLTKTGDPRVQGRDPWQSYVYRQTTGYGASFNMSLSKAERDAARGRGAHKPE